MTAADLHALCRRHGIATRYHDMWGHERSPPESTLRALLAAMGVAVEDGGDAATAGANAQQAPAGAAHADAPPIDRSARCHVPARRPGERWFGPAIQLYALRSRRNWGIGDFTDLATLAALAARQGAAFVGLNPLHALFPDRPSQCSPYSPSTRLALNPLYLDVEAIDDYACCEPARQSVAAPAFQSQLRALRARPLVDYAGVAAAKLHVLRQVYATFRARHLEPATARGAEFVAFAKAHRDRAGKAALFDALQFELADGKPQVWGWPAWPAPYRDRHGPKVQDFAQSHSGETGFHLYLQWQADVQLAHAAKAARQAGMPIGLYRDLAVGANPGGAETWCAPGRFAMNAHVGAPPDAFNPGGQDWGLPPWIPAGLPQDGYAAWLDLLQANMRHAGGLRIDHVMGLMRLFWIPAGAAAVDGTYVRYPLDDLLALLAQQSERERCVVVGEDLGTVPDEVRTALADRRVHSCRVLYFERSTAGGFAAPHDYPEQALVSIATHDLPPLCGFWEGSDLAARDALRSFPSPAVRDAEFAARAAARPRLFEALAHAGLMAPVEALPSALDFDAVLAVHRYVARTPCALMAVQLEDVFGERLQVNLPATTDAQYPNWRRKIALDLEDWEDDGRFPAVCAAIRAEGRASLPADAEGRASLPADAGNDRSAARTRGR